MTLDLRRSSCLLFGLLMGMMLAGGGEEAVAADADSLEESVRSGLSTVDSLRAQREFRAALARLHELEQSHTAIVEILWRRAILWNDLGKDAETDTRALSAYRKALTVSGRALDHDSASAWAHVAKAVAAGRAARLVSSKKRSLELSRDVREHAERAIGLDSTLAPAYHLRARWNREVAGLNFFTRIVVKTVYGGLPDASMEQAVRDFQTALELEQRTYHHLELGKTYLDMGRRDAAREALRAALECSSADPFDPEYKKEARRYLAELR